MPSVAAIYAAITLPDTEEKEEEEEDIKPAGVVEVAVMVVVEGRLESEDPAMMTRGQYGQVPPLPCFPLPLPPSN